MAVVLEYLTPFFFNCVPQIDNESSWAVSYSRVAFKFASQVCLRGSQSDGSLCLQADHTPSFLFLKVKGSTVEESRQALVPSEVVVE